jgi:uncharacterized damage-inducible protein DinB
MTEALLQEFDREASTTRRVLERVPQDKLTWKPHPKSMSLGTLALHVASAPGFICQWALQDRTEISGNFQAPEAKTTAEILSTHDDSVRKTRDALTQIGDAGLMRDWKMTTPNGTTIIGMPKVGLIRSLVLNHAYHHRGQLSVYLRLLDVPVPPIYGPTADENPFAAALA